MSTSPIIVFLSIPSISEYFGLNEVPSSEKR